MRTRGFDVVRRGLHLRADERMRIGSRRVMMRNYWRGDIRIGSRRCNPQHDLVREPRDCIVGLADHLDDDS